VVVLLVTKLRKVYCWVCDWNFVFKSVNIWQSYLQERNCLVHFLRLLARRAPCSVFYKKKQFTYRWRRSVRRSSTSTAPDTSVSAATRIVSLAKQRRGTDRPNTVSAYYSVRDQLMNRASTSQLIIHCAVESHRHTTRAVKVCYRRRVLVMHVFIHSCSFISTTVDKTHTLINWIGQNA